ncbi:MAG: DUF1501 domain-containing protein [Betaproteobacteria bacterium]|nr:DUF1501 domain-containing protein [Betaproteobacteria bacterium]
MTSPQRRKLLKLFAATGLLAAVERNLALAQTAPDYKALVCIYLQGGNDGENTLIRYDNAGYQNYAAIRAPASGINVPQAQLKPIQPLSLATPFGFHPACAPLQALLEQRKLAVVANMGMLMRPSTRIGLESQGAPRPANLFSHNDQERELQSGDGTGFTREGWGGRIADKLDAANPGTLFPVLISTNGMKTFTSGRASIPLAVPENPYFTLYSSGNPPTFNAYQYDVLRDAALREILAQNLTNTYDLAARLLSEEGLAASSVVQPILQNTASIVKPFFANLSSGIANQLKTVALLMEGRAQTQMKRQVFYAHQNGYDTHGAQAGQQHNLLNDLSLAIKAFQDALAALQIANNVTSFTLSDFGRTFKPAGNGGTDHAWGNYAFVIGSAVRGGDFYGTLPVQALDGPNDLGRDGRWIPTTSLEQYGATLTRWLGIAEADLPYVFPNIGAFANTNMGFMN